MEGGGVPDLQSLHSTLDVLLVGWGHIELVLSRWQHGRPHRQPHICRRHPGLLVNRSLLLLLMLLLPRRWLSRLLDDSRLRRLLARPLAIGSGRRERVLPFCANTRRERARERKKRELRGVRCTGLCGVVLAAANTRIGVVSVRCQVTLVPANSRNGRTAGESRASADSRRSGLSGQRGWGKTGH